MREHLRAATFGRSLIDFAPATLAQADAPPEAPAERSGQTIAKNRPAPAEHARPASGHAWPRTTHDSPRSPQAGASAAGYASPAATGTARRGPQETPCTETDGTQTPHGSAGRAQDERKIKPGEFTPGKRKCSTEPPRRRHAKRAGGRQQGSKTPQQGETPTRAKRKPAGSVAPGGIESLKQGLEHGPAKNNDVYDQHSASPPNTPRRASSASAAISAALSCDDAAELYTPQAARYRRRSAIHCRRVSKSSVVLISIHAILAPPINSRG